TRRRLEYSEALVGESGGDDLADVVGVVDDEHRRRVPRRLPEVSGLPPRRPPLATRDGLHDIKGLLWVHRLAEVEALGVVACEHAKTLDLNGRLHALGECRPLERVSHADDGTDDGRGLLLAADAVDEGAVDLDRLQGEALEGREA